MIMNSVRFLGSCVQRTIFKKSFSFQSSFAKEQVIRVASMSSSTTPNGQNENPFNSDVLSFMEDAYKKIINDVLVKAATNQSKVVDFVHPEKLKELMNFPIKEEGVSHQQLLEDVDKVIKYSVKTAHPGFMNQQYGSVNPYSLTGAFLSEALNTNAHTFEVAPVFILAEKYIIEKINSMVGFTDGDGIFAPGGTMGTFVCMNAALYRRNKDIKTKGLFGQKPLVMYSQENCHYSIQQGATFLGFGMENAVKVKTDANGKMSIADLELKIQKTLQEGGVPFFVMSSMGTTVLGAFDSLNEISDICEKYNMWHHADCAWGGAALLSDKYRHLLDGLNRTDSLTWNFHKMMSAQLQTSVALLKHKDLLFDCYTMGARYLFQQDKFYDVTYDMGDKSVQCGRKAEGVKLWLMWRALGDKGMGRQVDKMMENAEYIRNKIRNTPGFRLCMDEWQFTNTCFWYVPPRLRGKEETPEWWQEMDQVAPAIKERMTMDGTMLIGFCRLASHGWVNFFRLVLSNPYQNQEYMDFVINEIDRLGRDL